MGRGTLPPQKHTTHFKILMALAKGDSSSYGIAKILNASQSNIYTQMRVLEKENYIIPTNKNNYRLNIKQLKQEYLYLAYNSNIKDMIPPKHRIENNKYFNFIFDNYIKEISKHIDRTGDLTLNDFFTALHRTIRFPVNTSETSLGTGKIMLERVFTDPTKDIMPTFMDYKNFLRENDKDYRDIKKFSDKLIFIEDILTETSLETGDKAAKYFDKEMLPIVEKFATKYEKQKKD